MDLLKSSLKLAVAGTLVIGLATTIIIDHDETDILLVTPIAAKPLIADLKNAGGQNNSGILKHMIESKDHMPNLPIDLKKLEGQWIFERPGRGGLNAVSAMAKIENGKLMISLEEGTVVNSIIVEPDGDVLKGTFTFSGSDPEHRSDVEIRVDTHPGELLSYFKQAPDAKMIALPPGFRNLEIWWFKRP